MLVWVYLGFAWGKFQILAFSKGVLEVVLVLGGVYLGLVKGVFILCILGFSLLVAKHRW